MSSAKTPIRIQDIRNRAARKLGETSTNQSAKQTNKIKITGSMVKPIHVSNTDPLVKRMIQYKKIN
ncbi:hypothetical protein ACIQ4Z_14760 [Peribacillus asahii]|uniref:hypothetical protein n=1 Tax=Peribacillus asahii TaxID=228899 RepID=UPI00207A9FAD|nr:hypothetical protein [Peribacillus asahii]USK72260.1 hypothetical protein LIS76_11160 [Peribacillus asahii]